MGEFLMLFIMPVSPLSGVGASPKFVMWVRKTWDCNTDFHCERQGGEYGGVMNIQVKVQALLGKHTFHMYDHSHWELKLT